MPELLMPELKPLACVLLMIIATMLAACGQTTGTSTSQPMPVANTPEKIKGECWMKYEGDNKLSLDQRAALVDQCFAERTRPQAPVN